VESDSEEEYVEIEIKTKMREFRKENGEGVRYTEEIMNEAFRWRLNQNDCQNRGYVLDGYPESYETAKGVFVITPKPTVRKMIKNDEGEMVPEEIDEEEEKQRMKPRF
jgi:adenylate kinase family enzyme